MLNGSKYLFKFEKRVGFSMLPISDFLAIVRFRSILVN